MSSKRKIGGWLLLLGFHLIVIALIAGYGLINYVNYYLTPDWRAVLIENDLSSFQGLFFSESLLFLFILIGATVVLIKFVNKKSRFRDFYITFMVLTVIGYCVTYYIASGIDKMTQDKLAELSSGVFFHILWTIIWTLYLFKSSRAKETFVQ